MGQAALLGTAIADVSLAREANRRRRLRRVAIGLTLVALWLWLRVLAGDPVGWGLPTLGEDAALYLPGLLLVLLFGAMAGIPLIAAGRSPHVLYRSSEINVGMDDVRGAGIVKEEVGRTLDLFLAH